MLSTCVKWDQAKILIEDGSVVIEVLQAGQQFCSDARDIALVTSGLT